MIRAALCAAIVGGAIACAVDHDLGDAAGAWTRHELAVLGAAPTPAVLTPAPTTPPPPPSSTPAPAVTPPWSADECAWVLRAMERDLSLDTAEVAALKAGTDTRYPAADIPVYQQWETRWTVVVGQVRGICATPAVLPTPGARDATLRWFAEAVTAHRADAAAVPADAAWDEQWVGVYTRLEADYAELRA